MKHKPKIVRSQLMLRPVAYKRPKERKKFLKILDEASTPFQYVSRVD